MPKILAIRRSTGVRAEVSVDIDVLINCRNGLTMVDDDFAHISIRHFDVSADAFAKAAQSAAENTPRALEAVARWHAVQLPQATRLEFARRRAAALRCDADQPVMRNC